MQPERGVDPREQDQEHVGQRHRVDQPRAGHAYLAPRRCMPCARGSWARRSISPPTLEWARRTTVLAGYGTVAARADGVTGPRKRAAPSCSARERRVGGRLPTPGTLCPAGPFSDVKSRFPWKPQTARRRPPCSHGNLKLRGAGRLVPMETSNGAAQAALFRWKPQRRGAGRLVPMETSKCDAQAPLVPMDRAGCSASWRGGRACRCHQTA